MEKGSIPFLWWLNELIVGGLPPRLFGYFAAIRGRHIVATQPNRGLRPGTAGQRSGDNIKFLGQPETRLRQ